jgi:hypothetical protein
MLKSHLIRSTSELFLQNIALKNMRKFVSILVFLALTSCSVSQSNHKQKAAEQIILKIDAYSHENGRLPASLNEIGVRESEEGPIYFHRLTDSTYEVWYGTSLGESVTYNSATATWK